MFITLLFLSVAVVAVVVVVVLCVEERKKDSETKSIGVNKKLSRNNG